MYIDFELQSILFLWVNIKKHSFEEYFKKTETSYNEIFKKALTVYFDNQNKSRSVLEDSI